MDVVAAAGRGYRRASEAATERAGAVVEEGQRYKNVARDSFSSLSLSLVIYTLF